HPLSTTLTSMTEWTPEALKAEIAYRRATAHHNWQHSRDRQHNHHPSTPSWLHRVIHRTSTKPSGTSP
ncbi:hypothetical protein, partial [Nocardia sp. NRRL S-836]|uniref:hypothetical protein n=1 Tax=Nocardia sp. NRRL S-836 TaxID=1519492 RepID=UPI000A7761E8